MKHNTDNYMYGGKILKQIYEGRNFEGQWKRMNNLDLMEYYQIPPITAVYSSHPVV